MKHFKIEIFKVCKCFLFHCYYVHLRDMYFNPKHSIFLLKHKKPKNSNWFF